MLYLIFPLVALVSAALCFYLAARINTLEAEPSLKRVLQVLFVTSGAISLVDFMFLRSLDAAEARIWAVTDEFWPLAIAASLHFTIIYTRTRPSPVWVPGLIYSIAGLFSVIGFVPLASGSTFERAPWGWQETSSRSVLYQILVVVFAVGTSIYALVLIVIFRARATESLVRKQATVVTIAVALPFLLSGLSRSAIPALGLSSPPLTTLGLGFQSIIIGVAIHRYQLLKLSAQSAAEEIVDTLPDAFFLLDSDLHIIRANAVASGLSGLSATQIVGSDASALFPDLDLRDQSPLQGREVLISTAGGKLVPVSLSQSILRDEQDTIVGYVCIAQDLTERKETEDQLREMEVRMVLQQRLESIATLASGVAHEINNPLTGILNYAELLLDDLSEPESIEFVSEIQQLSIRIAEIVRNLLQYSDLETQGPRPENMANLVEETATLLRQTLVNDKVGLVIEMEDDLPDISCRRAQVQQVITNLVVNARDALLEATSSKNRTIKILGRQQNGAIQIRISDTGVGISEQVLPHVFDPFFTTKGRDVGTGLGLSVTYQIMKEHGGNIQVESSSANGTVFLLDFPPTTGNQS